MISLPQRSDRRAGIGPFPSGRDALKFVSYAAVGALLVPLVGLWVWLPFLGVGFFVSVKKVDGRSPEKRIAEYASFYWRRLRSSNGSPARSLTVVSTRGRLARTTGGRCLAVVVASGIPVRYLPPEDLQRLFVAYRELLRSTDIDLALVTATEPNSGSAFRPGTHPVSEECRGARDGYREMVTTLCRRRLRRRVFLTFSTLDSTGSAISRLEASIRDLVTRLGGLGIETTRLENGSLAGALGRLGWPIAESRGIS